MLLPGQLYGIARAADPDPKLTAEIQGQLVEQITGSFEVFIGNVDSDFVAVLVPRGSAWKLAPRPSYKFQGLSGAQAEQTVRYALQFRFNALPIVVESTRVAVVLAPGNPTPSGASLGIWLLPPNLASRSFDIHVEARDGGGSAGGSAGGAGGGGAGGSI